MIKKGLHAHLSEIGKIKIGGKGKLIESANKKKYHQPVKFGHFKVTTTERGADNNFMPDVEVMEKLGAEPKEIAIRFPFDDIDMNFHTSFQLYDKQKKVCQGDGETCQRKDANGVMTEQPCDTETCKNMLNGKCKVSGILSCYLPASPSYGGVYRFRTHGWNSVGGILKALQDYSAYTGGILQGLPFKLKFIKKHTEEHGNVPVVALVMDGVELADMRKLAIEEKRGRAALNTDIKAIEHAAVDAGFLEDTDAPEDVEAEFYTDDEPDGPGMSSDDVMEAMTDDKAEPEAVDEPSDTDKSEGADESAQETVTDKKDDLF